jgi:fumarate reductase subunit D
LLLSLILWTIGDFIILFKTITNIPLKFVALEDIFYMFFPIPIFVIYSKIIKLKILPFRPLTIFFGIISLIVLTVGILYPLIFLNPSTSSMERFVWIYYTITDWLMILLAVISLQSLNKNVEYKFLASVFIFSLLYGLADIIFSMSALWLTPQENIVNSSLIYEFSFFPLFWFLIN